MTKHTAQHTPGADRDQGADVITPRVLIGPVKVVQSNAVAGGFDIVNRADLIIAHCSRSDEAEVIARAIMITETAALEMYEITEILEDGFRCLMDYAAEMRKIARAALAKAGHADA